MWRRYTCVDFPVAVVGGNGCCVWQRDIAYEEVLMKRMMVTLVVLFVVGIAIGVVDHQCLSAGEAPVKVTEISKTKLAGSPGKEGSLFLVEIAPGAAVGKHYHPGDAFGYILEGTMTLVVAGKPPVTLKTGESGHVAPKQVHDDQNASTTAPVKLLVFHVAKPGQPMAVPVKK
jgi:quercetin dioxygenase-like cupin family protein